MQIRKTAPCVLTSGDIENKQSFIKNAKHVTVLFHNRTQNKTGILGLNDQPIEYTLLVDFPISSSKDGIHLHHALGSVHV